MLRMAASISSIDCAPSGQDDDDFVSDILFMVPRCLPFYEGWARYSCCISKSPTDTIFNSIGLLYESKQSPYFLVKIFHTEIYRVFDHFTGNLDFVQVSIWGYSSPWRSRFIWVRR